ncbi:MAG: YggT family protein [Pseudomonas sp.]
MTGLDSAGIYLVQTLGSLYLLIVLLRFVLQWLRADFFNPVSQFVVRATQPLLKPLRRLIPGVGGFDLASLVLALLLQTLLSALMLVLSGAGGLIVSLLPMLLLWSLIAVLALFAKIFFFALVASVILSWVAQGSHNPGVLLVNQLCEPLLSPIRRILPNLGGLDLSPIFAFIALNLFDMLVIRNLAALTHMPTMLRQML